jgi:hypothetical protein
LFIPYLGSVRRQEEEIGGRRRRGEERKRKVGFPRNLLDPFTRNAIQILPLVIVFAFNKLESSVK